MSQLISVIIPTFNRGDFLLRALNSVFSQTYKNIEVIVVDDGSTDNTASLLQSYISENKIIYIKQDNLGVSAARNTGVKKSHGNLITFLDSDDEWVPHKLQSQLDFLSKKPEIQIVFTEEIWIRKEKRVNQKMAHRKLGGHIFKNCVDQCLIAPSSVMLTKKLFDEMKGFDENYLVCEDYDLWLKISSLYEIGFISHPLIIKHGGHHDQLSMKFVAMDMWRLKSLTNILKMRTLSPADHQYVIETMIKKGTILMQGYLKYKNELDYNFVKELLAEFI
jgi:glycosyltransferase involved in cell wall biosynthesis